MTRTLIPQTQVSFLHMGGMLGQAFTTGMFILAFPVSPLPLPPPPGCSASGEKGKLCDKGLDLHPPPPPIHVSSLQNSVL